MLVTLAYPDSVVTYTYNLVSLTRRRCPAAGKVTVGLAMCPRLKWFVQYELNGVGELSTLPTRLLIVVSRKDYIVNCVCPNAFLYHFTALNVAQSLKVSSIR